MYQFFIKRVLDIVLSILILPVSIALMIPTAVCIKLEDRGKIFFTGKRLGKNMEQFSMYKFRSMKENAKDIRNTDGSTFNSDNDSRVTNVGGVIRKTSIDELPQIFNVLKGEMSFVGPRPSPLGNESRYTAEFKKKFSVKPGITGYNQALLRNKSTMEQRMNNDIYYTENISFILDVKIIYLTIVSVITRKNINHD